MKNRDTIKTVILILDVANQGNDTMTKIMNMTLFTHPQWKKYGIVLTEDGLLSYAAITQTLKTTK